MQLRPPIVKDTELSANGDDPVFSTVAVSHKIAVRSKGSLVIDMPHALLVQFNVGATEGYVFIGNLNNAAALNADFAVLP